MQGSCPQDFAWAAQPTPKGGQPLRQAAMPSREIPSVAQPVGWPFLPGCRALGLVLALDLLDEDIRYQFLALMLKARGRC